MTVMEKENIYTKIERLRNQRIDFDSIEKELVNEYDIEEVIHSVKYARNQEKRDLYLLSIECDDVTFFGKMALYIFGFCISLLLFIASIYFFLKFSQVLRTPEVIHRDNVIIIFNDLWKGKLTISLIGISLISIAASFTIFGASIKSYRDTKERRAKYLLLKRRQ
jgi:hypothetical protein